jgi:large subunit ribosomal protein L18
LPDQARPTAEHDTNSGRSAIGREIGAPKRAGEDAVRKNLQETVRRRRDRRQKRVRKRLFGSLDRPRLAIFRSSKLIYAQVVNDTEGKTLAAAGTLEGEVKGQLDKGYGGNKAAAAIVGRVLAERAKQAGIDKVCFDRRSYRYHGRIQALAEAAREAGLQF